MIDEIPVYMAIGTLLKEVKSEFNDKLAEQETLGTKAAASVEAQFDSTLELMDELSIMVKGVEGQVGNISEELQKEVTLKIVDIQDTIDRDVKSINAQLAEQWEEVASTNQQVADFCTEQDKFAQLLTGMGEDLADLSINAVSRHAKIHKDIDAVNARIDESATKVELDSVREGLALHAESHHTLVDLVKDNQEETKDSLADSELAIQLRLAKDINTVNTRIDESATKSELIDINDTITLHGELHVEAKDALYIYKEETKDSLANSELAIQLRLADVDKHIDDSRDQVIEHVTGEVLTTLGEKVEVTQLALSEENQALINEMSKELKGERGETGSLQRAQKWVDDYLFKQLAVVRHCGGLWQSKCETEEEPHAYCHDWVLLASGVQEIKTHRTEDITQLELIVRTSDGEDHTQLIDFPMPVFFGTFEEKKSYKFYDSVIDDGNRWIAATPKPKGRPCKSDDWHLFGMRGKRGLRGHPGKKGDPGPMPPVNKVLEALIDYENRYAAAVDGVPVRVWRRKWVYGEPYTQGDLITFGSGLWIATADEESAAVPPSSIANNIWAIMLDVQHGANDADAVKWKNVWTPVDYVRNDMVIDGDWTMIANKFTSDPAAPTIEGVPAYSLPDVNTWTDAQYADICYTGAKFRTESKIVINGLRVWIPVYAEDINYTAYLIDDTDPANPIVIETADIDLLATGTGWTNFNFNVDIIAAGINITVLLVTRKFIPAEEWVDYWVYTPVSPPPPSQFSVDATFTTLYVHGYSNSQVDQSDQIALMVAGDQISTREVATPSRWDIYRLLAPPVLNGAFDWEISVVRIANGGAIRTGKYCSLSFVPSQTVEDAPYSYLPDYWLANPSSGAVSGLQGFLDNKYPATTFDDNAYGVDVKFAVLNQSPDWDIVSNSVNAADSDPSDTSRMRWLGTWESGDYVTNDVVRDGNWTMIANNPTSDRAAPQTIGQPFQVYTGTLTPANTPAKIIYYGTRYITQVDAEITAYRVYTNAGFTYQVFYVSDPLGVAKVEQLLLFEAQATEWLEIQISPLIGAAGSTFDIIVQVNQPAAVPTTWGGNWDYDTPNNPVLPLTGQCVHDNKTTGMMSFHATDDDGTDRHLEFDALTVGDRVSGAGITWDINEIVVVPGATNDLNHYEFTVVPAIQGTPDGITAFTFETVTEVPIQYDVEVGANTATDTIGNGLFIADGGYGDIVEDNNQYGVDITLQQITLSPDWDIVAISSNSGSSAPAVAAQTSVDPLIAEIEEVKQWACDTFSGSSKPPWCP